LRANRLTETPLSKAINSGWVCQNNQTAASRRFGSPTTAYVHDPADDPAFVADQRDVVGFLDRKTHVNPFILKWRCYDQPDRPAGNISSPAGEFFATMVRLTSSDGEGRLNRFWRRFRAATVASVTSRHRRRAVRSLPSPFMKNRREPRTRTSRETYTSKRGCALETRDCYLLCCFWTRRLWLPEECGSSADRGRRDAGHACADRGSVHGSGAPEQ
jgi:hypothetical protein